MSVFFHDNRGTGFKSNVFRSSWPHSVQHVLRHCLLVQAICTTCQEHEHASGCFGITEQGCAYRESYAPTWRRHRQILWIVLGVARGLYAVWPCHHPASNMMVDTDRSLGNINGTTRRSGTQSNPLPAKRQEPSWLIPTPARHLNEKVPHVHFCQQTRSCNYR